MLFEVCGFSDEFTENPQSFENGNFDALPAHHPRHSEASSMAEESAFQRQIIAAPRLADIALQCLRHPREASRSH
ncbi:MAG TPA: hypothetical protein VMV34_08865, partial [Terriglobia bacterium]|nr:hypothetical protein [Terriglobia bacterium]